MAEILPWQPSDTAAKVSHHLAEGRCVCLPTESSYEIVASALHPSAVARLPANLIAAIVVTDYAELWDWLPYLRGAALRLFRKLGAGPVVLRADHGYRSGLWSRLPAATQRAVAPDGRLAIRWPAQPIWSEVRHMGLPLVAASLPEGANAAAVAQVVGASVACVVEAGPDHGSTAPSVIRVEGRRCIVERAGAFSQDDIDQLSLCRALFVCTGNTCRSPMASAMLSKLLADHWGISGNDLNSGGFFVQSAGLAAMMGAPASPDAVTVVADLGGDLSQHRSGMITMEMLLWADYLFGMTAGHCYTLESLWSEGMTPPRLLSPTHEDIADPIGGALVDYRTCAAQILACLQARLPEFLES